MRFEHLSQFLGDVKMKGRKGFTLIELMVVIFIVGILAAVAIPIMRGRIDSAKWSEGKAGAGSIRTAARAFCAEKGSSWGGTWTTVSLSDLGFQTGDLDGRYFTDGAYAFAFTTYDDYLVTVTAASSTSTVKPSSPSIVTIDEDGVWAETP